jgi:hypothetical protein
MSGMILSNEVIDDDGRHDTYDSQYEQALKQCQARFRLIFGARRFKQTHE